MLRISKRATPQVLAFGLTRQAALSRAMVAAQRGLTAVVAPQAAVDAAAAQTTADTKITGAQVDANITSVDASKIAVPPWVTGQQVDGSITTIDGGLIKTGTILANRIATIPSGQVSGLGALATKSTVADADITGVAASKVATPPWVTGAQVDGSITTIDGGLIKTGTILANRIATIPSTQVSGLGTLAAKNTVANADITTIDGGKITTGTIDAARINAISVAAANLSIGGTSFDYIFQGAKYVIFGSCGYVSGTVIINGPGPVGAGLTASIVARSWKGATRNVLKVAFPVSFAAWPQVFLQPDYVGDDYRFNYTGTIVALEYNAFYVGLIGGDASAQDANQNSWQMHFMAIGN